MGMGRGSKFNPFTGLPAASSNLPTGPLTCNIDATTRCTFTLFSLSTRFVRAYVFTTYYTDNPTLAKAALSHPTPDEAGLRELFGVRGGGCSGLG